MKMNMQMSVKVKKFLLKTKLLFVVLTFLFPAPASFAIEPMSDPTNPQGPVVPFVADASQETTVIEVRPGESIQAAIDQARDGDVILLSEGTYDYSGALTVNKAITLRGQSREGVTLQSNIAVDANGATIENLTVDPGQFVYSGGVQGGIGTFRASTSITISGRGNSVKNCTIKGFSPLLVESAQDTLLDHNLILDRAALWSLRGYENAALRPAVWIRDSNGIEILHNTISVPDRVSYLWGYRFADGHGVVESSSDNIVIKNSIIVAEGGSDFQHGSAIVYDGAAPTVTYSIVRTDDLAILNQTGVLNVDPLFVSDTDFRLRYGSPAIDAGDPNSPRDPDGTRADIGAFYPPSAPVVDVVFVPSETRAESRTDINEFTTLLAEKGITHISREEIQALYPTLDEGTFEGEFLVSKYGDRTAVAVSGTVEHFNCYQDCSHGTCVNLCVPTGMISYSKILYKPNPDSQGATIRANRLGGLKMGFTREGELLITPEHQSITIYDETGEVSAFARRVERAEIEDARSLITQYTGQNGRIRYRALAEALVSSGDARLAARVIAQIAINSYRATGQTDTRLLNQVTRVGFLIDIYAVGNPAEFWNPYELTQNESPAVVGPVRAALERRIRFQGAVFTPQGDKILYHVTQRSNDILAIYDIHTRLTRYQTLGTYGFSGVKMITPDGQYAIVASSVNTVYVVPLQEEGRETRLVFLPVSERVTDSVLITARLSRDGATVTLTTRDRKQYVLNYLTGELREIRRRGRV